MVGFFYSFFVNDLFLSAFKILFFINKPNAKKTADNKTNSKSCHKILKSVPPILATSDTSKDESEAKEKNSLPQDKSSTIRPIVIHIQNQCIFTSPTLLCLILRTHNKFPYFQKAHFEARIFPYSSYTQVDF